MPEVYVLDSFALLSFYQKEKGFRVVKKILQRAGKSEVKIFLSEINAGEIFYLICKRRGEEKAKTVLANLWTLPIEFVLPKREHILAAARFKSKKSISYADCFVLEIAVREKAKVVTGDPEFKMFADTVDIFWLE